MLEMYKSISLCFQAAVVFEMVINRETNSAINWALTLGPDLGECIY